MALVFDRKKNGIPKSMTGHRKKSEMHREHCANINIKQNVLKLTVSAEIVNMLALLMILSVCLRQKKNPTTYCVLCTLKSRGSFV